MRYLLCIFAFLLVVGVFRVEPKSTTGSRVLVLLDKEDDKTLYNKFFNSLEEREYNLTYTTPTDSTVDLFSYGERAYDHIINFAPKTKSYKDKVNPLSLLNFVNKGGNILLGASSELSETIRDFAREFDIDFDDIDTSVIDHFNYDMSDDGKHTLIVANGITNNEAILTKNVIEGPPVLFRGIAHKVGTVPLLTKVLWAGETAYSYETKADQQVDQEPLVIGNEVMLVSALQARNNARVTFVGSIELFSDRFFDSSIQRTNPAESFPKSGNEDFAKDLTKWTFQEKGVLKVTSKHHHKEGEGEELEIYRIKDNIVYIIEISEYVNDHWQPFNGTDVQFEAIMLDPYIRKTLTPYPTSPEQQSRKYEAHIQLPDVYGVFTFKVNYKRSGYSYIEDSTVVAIRPFRHNEYPRYISAAYPYYTGAASMIMGFLLFSVVWFFNKENTKRVKKKTS